MSTNMSILHFLYSKRRNQQKILVHIFHSVAGEAELKGSSAVIEIRMSTGLGHFLPLTAINSADCVYNTELLKEMQEHIKSVHNTLSSLNVERVFVKLKA